MTAAQLRATHRDARRAMIAAEQAETRARSAVAKATEALRHATEAREAAERVVSALGGFVEEM